MIDELKSVIGYLREQSISDQVIMQLELDYAEADRKRHSPKVSRNGEGRITSIGKISGYGEDERTINIASDGSTYWEFRTVEGQRLKEAMAGGGSFSNPIHKSFFPEQVKGIVDEAVKLAATEAEKGEITEWYESIKDKIGSFSQDGRNRNFFSGSFGFDKLDQAANSEIKEKYFKKP